MVLHLPHCEDTASSAMNGGESPSLLTSAPFLMWNFLIPELLEINCIPNKFLSHNYTAGIGV